MECRCCRIKSLLLVEILAIIRIIRHFTHFNLFTRQCFISFINGSWDVRTLSRFDVHLYRFQPHSILALFFLAFLGSNCRIGRKAVVFASIHVIICCLIAYLFSFCGRVMSVSKRWREISFGPYSYKVFFMCIEWVSKDCSGPSRVDILGNITCRKERSMFDR